MLRISEGKRLAKYALVGGLNTGVDFAVFCTMVYGLGMMTIGAQALSYTAGLVNSYFWNRYWTFQVKGQSGLGEIVRFVIINIMSFTAATSVLLGLEHTTAGAAGAKIVSVVVAMAVNYIGYRIWVFKEAERQGERAS
jgi:putative flippase GtrA